MDSLALDDEDEDEQEEEEEEEGKDAARLSDEDVDMDDAEPVLPLIEVSPPKKSKHKDKSKEKGKEKAVDKEADKEKEKKRKKRRPSEAMDVDGESDAGENEQPIKKIKLSKEEKRALEKVAKAAKKVAAITEVGRYRRWLCGAC